MSYFTKRYHPPGTSPGTLVTEGQEEDIQIQLLDYTPDEFKELILEHPRECQPYLERNSITWVHVEGVVHAETV
ncbi:MAG: magnesium and cobalt transport protein CorA, partial [Gammaproteobacteria bacterium]|nr:magnesium and cobalt transport protein CorA [Gammaproteobacteria bacterium]